MNNNKPKCTEVQLLREALINARKANNYCQDYVANKLSISQNAYSKFELGKHFLSFEKLIKLFEIYEIDFIGIIKGELQNHIQNDSNRNLN